MSAPLDVRPAAQSRSDRLLIHGLLALLAVAASLTPIRNYDYWWHLATGRWMVEHGTVPRGDPFSFTAFDAAWVDGEWLSQIVMAGAHGAWGPNFLVAVKVLVVAGLCLLVAGWLRREGHGPAGTAVLLAPALVGASFRLDVRPELATLVAAPMLVLLLLRARANGAVLPLVSVPILIAVWANLHPGVILAPTFLAAAWVMSLLWERLNQTVVASPAAIRWSWDRRLGLVTVAGLLATVVNPYGYRVLVVPFEVARLLAGLPSPNLEWARPGFGQFPLFWIALAVAGIVCLLGWRRIDPIAAPAMLIAGVLAAAHLRNIGLFFLLLPLGLARPLRSLVDRAQAGRPYRGATAGGRVRPGFVMAAVLLVGAIPALAWVPPEIEWGIGVAPGNEPRAAVDFLDRERVGGRLFNDVKFGGYLVWRRHPVHPVFIDGRNEIYPRLLEEIFAGLREAAAWNALLDRHRIDAAMLRYPPTLQKVSYPGTNGRPPVEAERAFSAAYFPKEDWALVYWDDDAMIFLRRIPGHAATIARLEYRAIHPDDWRYLWAGALIGRVAVPPILEEIERKLREDPGCARALWLRASFAALAGPPPSESQQGPASRGR